MMPTYSESAPFGCILNPGANRSRSLRRADKIRQFLDKHYPGSRIFITTSKEDIGAKAYEVSKEFGKLLVCGGDGTINEVVHSAIVTGAYIGIIPMGSGNDFVKTPGISRNLNKALGQLLTSKPIKADILRYSAQTEHGLVNGVVVNTLGIGFDGRANLEASRMRRIKGPLMYTVAALKSALYSSASRMDITFSAASTSFSGSTNQANLQGQPATSAPDHTKEGSISGTLPAENASISRDLLMLTLANGRIEGGNFEICPHADLTDGCFDMVMVPQVSLFTLLTRLPLFTVGLQRFTRVLLYQKASRVSVKMYSPLPMHVDGEQIGERVSALNAEIDAGALNLLVPQ